MERHPQSVRPRQLQRLQSVRPEPATPTFEPYQLKPKRDKIEPPVEVPPPNPKQITCMKKKLSKLNKKIRHSKRKHNNLISERNLIKKKIEELKGLSEQNEVFIPEEESLYPIELEQAFDRANRSYRINGRSRMDVETFFDQIRQNLTDRLEFSKGTNNCMD